MIDEEIERERFEYAERASDLRRDDDEPNDYANGYVQSAWEGWLKAKRDVAALLSKAIKNEIPTDILATVGELLVEAMSQAVRNGANSVSMPDRYVALAEWLTKTSEERS